MTEINNPAPAGENPNGSQPANGGEKTPEKKVEETGKATPENNEPKTDAAGNVILSKEEYDKLTAKRNSNFAQDRKNRKPEKDRNISEGKFSFKPRETRVPTEEEIDFVQAREFVKVKDGVAGMIMDNEELQSLVKNDLVLKKILRNDPLSLLDSMPIDADDALDQLEEVLADIINVKKPKETKKEPEVKKEIKPVPPQPKEPETTGDKKPDRFTPHQGFVSVESRFRDRLDKEAGV